MNLLQYDRIANLSIGTPGFSGISISDLRIVFDIQKTDSKEPNTAKISVYNLNRKTRDALNALGESSASVKKVVQLNAGYSSTSGAELLFIGGILSIYNEISKPDIVTHIEASDGGFEIAKSKSNLSYASGSSAMKVLKKVVSSFKLPNNLQSIAVSDKSYSNGFSFIGPSNKALDLVSAYLGLVWSIQDGELKFTAFDGHDSSKVLHLSPESGMLGSPERISSDERELKGKSKKKIYGWRVMSLLQPKVIPASVISLSSYDIKTPSQFTVTSVSHSGDTHGTEFSSVIEVKE